MQEAYRIICVFQEGEPTFEALLRALLDSAERGREPLWISPR